MQLMRFRAAALPLSLGLCLLVNAFNARSAEKVQVTIHANRPGPRPVSRYLTGACIEDVNHEIYGGLYSQMIFGESFQEPANPISLPGFKAFGGHWRPAGEHEVTFAGGPGDKLVSEMEPVLDGEVGAEVFIARSEWSNIGLIVRVSKPGPGNDAFDGYEVSLMPSAQSVRLGRHRQNWEPIRDVPCELKAGEWVSLRVALTGASVEVFVDGKSVLRHEETGTGLGPGVVGLRAFQSEGRWRNVWVQTGSTKKMLTFTAPVSAPPEISRMWSPVSQGTAQGKWVLTTEHPFLGKQSQRFTFEGGQGAIGIANQGLNRRGMHFQGGKTYEGIIWARAAKPVGLLVGLENQNGTPSFANKLLKVSSPEWQKLEFTLQPGTTATNGRFSLALTSPGSVDIGYAFLQPGKWGRYKGLPVRRDVAEGLVDQGITVLRYGGSMINHPEYRWKQMIGPRDRRPPYRGTWYEFSSNGWGITDFVQFCETAGFLAIPALNMGESPQDMADFVEYMNGPANSPWGARRAADGHPKSYGLKHIELGNEERVDAAYAGKFTELARAIWAKDPEVILVVGDFAYYERIRDPFQFRGAYSGVTTLAPQQGILQLAKENGREVWFDLHVGTEGPHPDGSLEGMFSFRNALEGLDTGANFSVAVFEFNAGNHSQRRALANASAILAVQRDGRIPVATSANCLQPDGQNDNGWNQGLLFLNPSQVWLQPPGYVTRMISRNYQPYVVPVEFEGPARGLNLCALTSRNGRTVVIEAVNAGDQPVEAVCRLEGFGSRKPVVRIEELAGPLDAVNTAARPTQIQPLETVLRPDFAASEIPHVLPAHSFTILRIE